MSVRLVCRACGKRLKLPDGWQQKRSAKCPKCLAPVDLTPALEASVYLSTQSIPGMAVPPVPPPTKPVAAKSGPPPLPKPSPPPLIGEDDPLPYPVEKKPPLPAAKPQAAPITKPQPPPLPKTPTPPAEEPLSLDDDESDLPPEAAPFRVPVRVLADSLRKINGPCVAVLLPHGVFLEHEPMKPFLYVPIGCAVESLASGELAITLPDRRAITLRFTGRSARPLARDTRAFLAGERTVPTAADYRRKWWMLWAALIFALGLSGGPLVLSQTANLGLEFGLQVGGGFALLGLLANVMVVLISRWSVPLQMMLMAGICALVSGIFFFGATAYLAGRQKAIEEVNESSTPGVNTPGSPNPGVPNPGVPNPPDPKPPEPPPPRAPSHIDRAKKNGSSALEDGPADVTALTIAPDSNTLAIGFADGNTRLWPLDQPTFEAMFPGPRADSAVTRMQFDRKSLFVFAHTTTGVFAAPRTGAPAITAKIPGTLVAIAPELDNDRVRFAALRGNTVVHRFLDTNFIKNPKVKGKSSLFATPNPKSDEIIPKDSARDPNRPGGNTTFLAWTPIGRLYAGQPNGNIAIWNTTMRPEAPSNDHKTAVKAWADCLNGDFATGDDKGTVALWSGKGGKPTLWTVFSGAPVVGLSFNATGSRLAITDNTGWLVIWDTVAGKALHRVKRPAPVKAMTYGPTDDIVILAAGKTVEVWSLPELVK